MHKLDFLSALYKQLQPLPQEDIKRYLEYYSEMIDDRVEDGLTEEEAIAQIGSVQELAEQILGENPPVRQKQRRKLSVAEIVLLVLGSPIWLSLLIAAVAVAVSVFAALWSVVIAVYAVDLALAVCAVASIPVCFLTPINWLGIVYYIGLGLICAGLAVLLFYGVNWVAKQMLKLTKRAFLAIGSCGRRGCAK